MTRKFKQILTIIYLLLLIILLLLISFYLTRKYIIDNNSEIVITDSLSINYHNGKKIYVNKNKEVKVTIINSSDSDAMFFIEFNNLNNTNGVKYRINDDNGFDISDTLDDHNKIISSYITIKSGESIDYTFTFTSDKRYSLEININDELLQNSFFADVILHDNEVKESSATKVGSEIATSDEGLIKSYDDYGTTYYFRGKVNNNYVRVNNLIFRIVRINGDGTVKLVLDEKISDLKKYYENIDELDFINTSLYNYLDTWLNLELHDYLSIISNNKYCDDLNYSNSINRVKIDYNPSFICLGNKIQSKVGLLTVDEVLYAGGSYNGNNNEYYLYNSNIDTDSYLMSGANYIDSVYYPFVLNNNGKVVDNISGNSLISARPVITIIKPVSVLGDGTVNNPYYFTLEK